MVHVRMYTKQDCLLCSKALRIVEFLSAEFSLDIDLCEIYENNAWLEAYHLRIPVVEIDGVIVDEGIVSEAKIRKYLNEFMKSK